MLSQPLADAINNSISKGDFPDNAKIASASRIDKESDEKNQLNLVLNNYMIQVNNRNTRTRCEICSKLTIKIPERRDWRRSGIFIFNFVHISHLV